MPTNYLAQVKKTAQTDRDHPDRDSTALVAHPTAKSVGPHAIRAQSAVADPMQLESGVVVPFYRKLRSRRGMLAYAFAKRTLDLILGSGLLVMATPVILIAALMIRIDTAGSPFFFQNRVANNGKHFKIFKLRGMFMDARVRFPAYYDYSTKPDLEFCFHHEDDPRVTRAGRWIRKTSIDELPNLWNVVLGDMSLVGPRPEIPEVMALYGSYADEYLSVKPGLTCFSKCTGRDRLTKKETIELDLNYVRRRSFTLDLKILWRTLRSVILRRDVF